MKINDCIFFCSVCAKGFRITVIICILFQFSHQWAYYSFPFPRCQSVCNFQGSKHFLSPSFPWEKTPYRVMFSNMIRNLAWLKIYQHYRWNWTLLHRCGSWGLSAASIKKGSRKRQRDRLAIPAAILDGKGGTGHWAWWFCFWKEYSLCLKNNSTLPSAKNAEEPSPFRHSSSQPH